MTRYEIVADAEAVALATADLFVVHARRAIDERGIFRVALSGGSTPVRAYRRLLEPERADAVDWSAVEFFWGDERAVPPDHPDSNFGAAWSGLISHLPGVRPELVHRMPAEADDLDAAALSYEAELRLAFGVRAGELPAFDLIWLGMGPDGHTASLFPGSSGLAERERWVIANWAPRPAAWRMTLTLPVLNAGRAVAFAVDGASKAPALREIMGGPTDLPASHVSGDQVEWIVDAAAAGTERARR